MRTLSYIVIAYLNVRSVTRRSSTLCFLGIWIMFIETEDQIYVALLHFFGVYYCCLLRRNIKYCTFSLYFLFDIINLCCVTMKSDILVNNAASCPCLVQDKESTYTRLAE